MNDNIENSLLRYMTTNLLLILLSAILVVQQSVPCIIIILCVVKIYVLLSTIEMPSLTNAMWKTFPRHSG